MRLMIDFRDGAGARDYSRFVESESACVIERRLNRAAKAKIRLASWDASFEVPPARANITIEKSSGGKLFTGYLKAAPIHEYLGWGERGPEYSLELNAVDESMELDRKPLASQLAMVDRYAGEALIALSEQAAPAQFDTSGVGNIARLPVLTVNPEMRWSEHAAEIALRTRARVRVHGSKIELTPLSATEEFTIEEGSAVNEPSRLRVERSASVVNDVTVLGRLEPRAHVKNYFLGDGLTLGFNLSHTPFTRRAFSLTEEEFKGTAVDASKWVITGSGVFSVGAGKLAVNGGAADHSHRIVLREKVELGGAVNLQHGEVRSLAASEGIVGGLFAGGFATAQCVAGFRATLSGGQTQLQSCINGVAAGTAITVNPAYRYALTTRLFSTEPYRRQQLFHSSVNQGVGARGGAEVPATVRAVMEVHAIDPNNPATLAAAAVILWEGVLSNPPGRCDYALAVPEAMTAEINFARIVRAVDAEVRSTIPGQATRTRLVGTVAEGAECVITQQPELQFFTSQVPVPNETIKVAYRSRGRALARRVDEASVAAQASGSDDGVRAEFVRLVHPAARTAQDCENAALAMLDDSVRAGFRGEYACTSDAIGGSGDPWPGDRVHVISAARGVDESTVIRECTLKSLCSDGDLWEYQLRFGNDSAEPLAFQCDDGFLREPIEFETTAAAFTADLANAEVTAMTSTSVAMDAGMAPPAGWGIEVRRNDSSWGAENDRNLVGRFTTQTFSVIRLTRVQTYYLRLFDDATPRRYSRYAAVLHVDYPL